MASAWLASTRAVLILSISMFMCVFIAALCDMSRYALCILTSYVKKTVPELELALQHIQSIRGYFNTTPVVCIWLRVKQIMQLTVQNSKTVDTYALLRSTHCQNWLTLCMQVNILKIFVYSIF